MSWGCHADLRYIVTELVTNMRPAHNTIVKTEWNNFRLIHFIVWALINMFVVTKLQWSKLPIKSHFQRVKNIFYFPNTNSVHLAAIRIPAQHDNGSTGSGYNFSCRSRRSQAADRLHTVHSPGLPVVLASAAQWSNESNEDKFKIYNTQPQLVQSSLADTGYKRKRGVIN